MCFLNVNLIFGQGSRFISASFCCYYMDLHSRGFDPPNSNCTLNLPVTIGQWWESLTTEEFPSSEGDKEIVKQASWHRLAGNF